MHVPLKNIVKIKAPAPKNSIFVFCSTPKEILNFNNLPLKNSMVPQPGVGGGGSGYGIRCNSPCVWWRQHNKTAAHKTMFSSCMARRPTVLDKIDGKFVSPSLPSPPSPPPPIKDGKLARFGFCPASSLIWGDGGLLFHFILFKIAGAVSRGG